MSTAAAILIALLAGLSPSPSDIHPREPIVVDCEEDDVWIFVDQNTTDGVEDIHGVTRACRNWDQLVDWAIEVAIQEGVLMYVPAP